MSDISEGNTPVKNAPLWKLQISTQVMNIPETASLKNCDQFNKLSVVQPEWYKTNNRGPFNKYTIIKKSAAS